MIKKILLVAAIFFVVELWVLIKVGEQIGALNTLVLMFALMALGSILIRLRINFLKEQFAKGQFDIKAIFIPLAGFLFFFPGFISDVIALFLLIPSIQTIGVNYYAKRHNNETVYYEHRDNNSNQRQGHTIEGTANRVDDDK